jgi:hypothetical protein
MTIFNVPTIVRVEPAVSGGRDSLQSLRGSFAPGDAAIVNGYFTEGDAGGGDFYYEGMLPSSATIIDARAAIVGIKGAKGATKVSPIVITALVAHGYLNGQSVLVEGVVGNAAANGVWLIKNTTATTFELVGSRDSGAYLSGGTAASVTVTTAKDHGLIEGSQVMLARVVGSGGPSINGTWSFIGVPTTKTFTLPIATTGSYMSGVVGDGGMSVPLTDVMLPPGRWLRRAGTGIFSVKWFGARGDSETDDVSAIRTAIIKAKTLPTSGGGGNTAGGRVFFPAGVYRCASTLLVDGSVLLEGTHAIGTLAASVLRFDENLRPAPYATEGAAEALVDIIQSARDGTGTLGNWVEIRDLEIQQPRTLVRDYTTIMMGIRTRAHGTRLHNISLLDIQGDGIRVDGTLAGEGNASGWTMGGSCRIQACDRYGMIVHGTDSSAGAQDGSLDLRSNGSWGLIDQSFLGTGWNVIHTELNGVCWDGTQWCYQGEPVTDSSPIKVWSKSAPIALGQLMLPTGANKNGFQFRATSTGADPHQAGITGEKQEPSWPQTIGKTVPDGSVTWTCWMEEGGPVRATNGNSYKTFKWIYQDNGQNDCEFLDSGFDMILGGNGSFQWTMSSRVNFGPSHGHLVPFSVYSRRSDPLDKGLIVRPTHLRMGSQDDPRVGFSKYSGNSPDVPRPFIEDVNELFIGGVNELRDYWDRKMHRWSRQAISREQGHPAQDPKYYKFFSYTESDGRSGPQPGAVNWPTLWLGGVIGLERRLTALPAQPARPYAPDFTNSAGSAKGAYRVNDLLWNVGSAGSPSVPLLWRVKAVGGVSVNNWGKNLTYEAGILIRPWPSGINGDPLYLALNYGRTGETKPAFKNEPGETYEDGPGVEIPSVKWEWWGNAGNDAIYEPVIHEFPSTAAVAVTGGATVSLTEDQAGHARIRFTGVLTQNVKVVVPPGPARGWTRTFWNATTGPFALTLAATPTGGTGVVVAQGTVCTLFCDGTNVRNAAGQPVGTMPQYVANNCALTVGVIVHDAIYDVPATSAASTVTLPVDAPDATRVTFAANGTKNAHTVQYRDSSGPTNITTALTASKRHLVIAQKLGGMWFANAYVSP